MERCRVLRNEPIISCADDISLYRTVNEVHGDDMIKVSFIKNYWAMAF